MKKKTLDKVTIVKTMSRSHIGTVPGTKVVPQKIKRVKNKHPKQDLERANEDSLGENSGGFYEGWED